MRLLPAGLLSLEIVGNMDGQNGQTLMLHKGMLILPERLVHLFLIILEQLIGRLAGNAGQKGDQPKRQLLVLDLQQ